MYIYIYEKKNKSTTVIAGKLYMIAGVRPPLLIRS